MGALASVALTLGVSEADAQNFNTGNGSTYRTPSAPASNTTGTVTVTGGTIRMRSSDGTITGKYGSSETDRMPGIVIWYCQSTIPGGTFFTDLGTGGDGDKTIGSPDPNGNQVVDIKGDYKPEGPGKRNYADGSTIKFSGDDPAKPQTIPDESSKNGTGFDIVDLSGNAPKQTKDCDADSETHIKQLKQAGARFTNKGNLVLANKPNAPHTINEMTNDAGAAGTCGITLKEGGTMDIATNYTNTSGFWKLEDNSNINLAGSFTYTAGKMDFACNSNFHYMGTAAQTITGTPSTDENTGFYAYGNILFSQSEKTADGDFRVCNDLKTTSEVKLGTFTASMMNKTPANHVFFALDGGPEVDVEIEGKLEYWKVSTGTPLTYNNKNTKVTFETASDLNFALFVKGATAPDQATPINTTEDVSRKINVTYTGTGKISRLQTMWEEGDELGGFVAPAAGKPIRFAEGFDPSQERKKMIRVGATYNNDIANRIINYGLDGTAAGIELTNDNPTTAPTDPNQLVAFNQKLFSGSDILLSTKTQKSVSIANGRWSNPGTWDTGLEPAPNDDVEIRTTVWVGDNRQIFGGAAWEEDERAITSAAQGLNDGTQFAARSITIENVQGAGLFVNTIDNTLRKNGANEIVFMTQMVGEKDKVGIFNNNLNPEVEAPNTSGAGMNGIFLSAITDNYIPVLGAANWNNAGTFTNNGVAEVGTCLP